MVSSPYEANSGKRDREGDRCDVFESMVCMSSYEAFIKDDMFLRFMAWAYERYLEAGKSSNVIPSLDEQRSLAACQTMKTLCPKYQKKRKIRTLSVCSRLKRCSIPECKKG